MLLGHNAQPAGTGITVVRKIKRLFLQVGFSDFPLWRKKSVNFSTLHQQISYLYFDGVILVTFLISPLSSDEFSFNDNFASFF
jgi:hypothetical protein